MEKLLANAAALKILNPVNYMLSYQKGRAGSHSFFGIVDYTVHSSQKRFTIFNQVDGSFVQYFVAHGKGSEDGVIGHAVRFSNKPGSLMSSLGMCVGGEEYMGQHGKSMRLDGLEASNSNMRIRAIVNHDADYATANFVSHFGYCGRSEGCLAVDENVSPDIRNKLKNGGLIMLWHDSILSHPVSSNAGA